VGDGAGVELSAGDGVRRSSAGLHVVEKNRIGGGSTGETESAGGRGKAALLRACCLEQKVRGVELGSSSHAE
jgi:hypothetical protein